MIDKQTEGWVKVIRGTKSRASADCLQRVVRPRSKNLAFLLDRMPWDKEWTIRICLPGIDNGHAIWLESTFKRRSKKQAQEMVSKIVKLMPSVREWPNAPLQASGADDARKTK